MEAITTVQNEFTNSRYDDLANQPWYVRWGICVLGLLAAVILVFTSLSDILGAIKDFQTGWVGLIELALAVTLVCFEVTTLAKAFSFTWCGLLITFSEKASPLLRATIYGGAAIPIICVKGVTAVFILLPCIATGAAYFVLWMDSRKRDDEAPITQNEFTNDNSDIGFA